MIYLKPYNESTENEDEENEYDFIYDFDESEITIHFDTKKWLVITPLDIKVAKALYLFSTTSDFNSNGGPGGGLVFFINKNDSDRTYITSTICERIFNIYDSDGKYLLCEDNLDDIIKYFEDVEYFIADCIKEMTNIWESDPLSIEEKEIRVVDMLKGQGSEFINYCGMDYFLDNVDLKQWLSNFKNGEIDYYEEDFKYTFDVEDVSKWIIENISDDDVKKWIESNNEFDTDEEKEEYFEPDLEDILKDNYDIDDLKELLNKHNKMYDICEERYENNYGGDPDVRDILDNMYGDKYIQDHADEILKWLDVSSYDIDKVVEKFVGDMYESELDDML